jgi:hypothetical protein
MQGACVRSSALSSELADAIRPLQLAKAGFIRIPILAGKPNGGLLRLALIAETGPCDTLP